MTTESTAPEKKKLHPDVVAKIDRIQDRETRRTLQESLCCVHHPLQEQPRALRQGSLKSQPRHLARDIPNAHRKGQPTAYR
jgi:hypothetical protein